MTRISGTESSVGAGTGTGVDTGTGAGTARAWAALGGGAALLSRVRYGGGGGLSARLPVMELARSTVAACALAAAELAADRAGSGVPRVRVDDGAVGAAFLSDRLVRLDGAAPTTFAPLSRFWRAADGWVRTHANYPHHRERLLTALGLPADAGAADVEAAIGAGAARDVEDAVYAAGGLAVAARTVAEWGAGEQARALAARPLLSLERLDDSPVRKSAPLPEGPLLPAAGLRVLDLTRVLAGPVATRTLALLGADVLRIDSPGLPESQDAHNDTGMGKRSTRLDLAAAGDRAVFESLLASADVVVTGYRPGALDRFGLAPADLAARRPGLVVAQVSAWGTEGPWGGRRGFDSLVQVATGIAAVEGGAGEPGALPAQALDHGTGYLMAAAVLRAVTEQRAAGGSRVARLALARTAHWLLHELPEGAGAPERPGSAVSGPSQPYSPEPWMTGADAPTGSLRYALPAVRFDGGPTDWARPAGVWGADAAQWV
ncbi:CoA transferase [Streptomyces sp. NPDC050504]|uniref:CoA transferase n=1 Tax=Streptomyces sp. NPDC050504 TaxID=3365618 RepID=UPI0037A9380A